MCVYDPHYNSHWCRHRITNTIVVHVTRRSNNNYFIYVRTVVCLFYICLYKMDYDELKVDLYYIRLEYFYCLFVCVRTCNVKKEYRGRKKS